MFDPVSASILAGGALAGGLLGSSATRRAAAASAAAQREATASQERMFGQQMEAQRPWREAGVRALPQLEGYDQANPMSRLMENWQADPGYEFRMQEGLDAVNGAGWAQGMGRSGNTLRALTDYGQRRGAEEYGNVYSRRMGENQTGFNRLASLAGVGQTATNQITGAQQNLGNTLANLSMQRGATQGQAAIAQGQIWGNAIGGAANAFGQYYGRQGGGGGGYGPGSAPMPGAGDPYRSNLGVAASQYGYD